MDWVTVWFPRVTVGWSSKFLFSFVKERTVEKDDVVLSRNDAFGGKDCACVRCSIAAYGNNNGLCICKGNKGKDLDIIKIGY